MRYFCFINFLIIYFFLYFSDKQHVKMSPITIVVSFLTVFNLFSQTLADPSFQDDVELLEGYENFRYPLQFDLNPEDEDLERKHLLTHFMTKAIRNKRAAKYKILESEGLRSHFRIEDFPVEEEDGDQEDFDGEFVRVRRSSEVTTTDKELNTKQTSEEPSTLPGLPTPEKLISPNSQYYQDHWSQYDKPRDSEAEATVYNEGIKARAPRVNFITKHQSRDGKSLDVSESRDTKNSILPETTTPDTYRKNLARIYLDYPRPYDTYPRGYDPYVFDNRRNYDHDYYDSYMPRTLSYPNFYYYPDKRYDVPGPREPYTAPDNTNAGNSPVPYATNEIPPLSPENRNRRIIYYTTLPEIVRARIPLETYLRSFYRYNPTPYNYYNYLTPHIIPPVSPYFFVAPVDPYRASRITRDYTKAIGSITQIHDLKDDYSKRNGNYGNNNSSYHNKNNSSNTSNNNNGSNNKNGRSDKNDGRSKNGRSSY